jgi:hypothetical protein
MYEAESEFHSDMAKFYASEENDDLIIGSSCDSGIQVIENTVAEKNQIEPLVNNLINHILTIVVRCGFGKHRTSNRQLSTYIRHIQGIK